MPISGGFRSAGFATGYAHADQSDAEEGEYARSRDCLG
jgi:hypothetical protein